jgi:CrcB protein
MRYVMIALGGALGALARYQVAALIQSRMPVFMFFPWGTFVVNISGCFVMGIVATALIDHTANPNLWFLIPVGFIGAYTTFSTFELETFRALADGAWVTGSSYVLGSLVAGYIALWLGVLIARLF